MSENMIFESAAQKYKIYFFDIFNRNQCVVSYKFRISVKFCIYIRVD